MSQECTAPKKRVMSATAYDGRKNLNRSKGFDSIREYAGEYLLSTYDDYNDTKSVLLFKCNSCGATYTTTVTWYKASDTGKKCLNCKKRLRVVDTSTRQQFIDKCILAHGLYYNYTKVPNVFKATDKITIICPKHGEFQQIADVHTNSKRGCSHCKIDYITSITRSNVVDFIFKSNNVHNFKYNYDKVVYVNAVTPVNINCPKHGPFLQTPDVHLHGVGCPSCVTSKPVNKIIVMLNKHNINYSLEKTFEHCVNTKGNKLRFDIYIPAYNMCVEYDGEHHYYPINYSNCLSNQDKEDRFSIIQQHDEIKTNYCTQHNINLLRIPYTYNHPDTILYKLLTEHEHTERYEYTYNMLSADIIKLANYINSFNYEKFVIYGILRGGIFFSIPLSYHFEGKCTHGVVTYQRYDGNDKQVSFDITHTDKQVPIFIIDDLISSGITMNMAIKAMKHKFKKAKIHPIVIFGDENIDNVMFIREHPKQWIVFPWET